MLFLIIIYVIIQQMEHLTLEQIIRQYVMLPPVPSGRGWYPVLHTTCDHGKKGPRAAWKFEGETVAFHCFNCPSSSVYNPHKHKTMPKKMEQILNDFNVPEDEWAKVVFQNMEHFEHHNTSKKDTNAVSIEPKEIELPDTFYLLADAPKNDKWAEVATWYLENRNINPDEYPFMLSRNTSDVKMKKWIGRVIIPIYKQNKLIFYQGRDLVGNKTKKYESPAVSRENVLFGFDQLFDYNNPNPLYISEGWFDAFHLNGIALFGNEVSNAQIEWINRSPRQKVFIPDKFGDGLDVALRALHYGWSVTTPDFGNDIKDIDEAVAKYGKLYVIKSLVDHTASGFEAELNLRNYCK